LPLAIGILLVTNQPVLWAQLGPWPQRISRVTRLQWLFRLSWWGMNELSAAWWNVLQVVEGAGYMGWVLVLFLMIFLLIR
jgi:hypothetical protein